MRSTTKLATRDDTPIWVVGFLESPLTVCIGRLSLTLPFWWSGVDKLIHPHAALNEIQSLGLPSSWALYVLLLIAQLAGSAAIIFNRFAWLGASGLIVFTAMATYLGHAFWRLQGLDRFNELNDFMEHISMMAGLLFAALHCHEIKLKER